MRRLRPRALLAVAAVVLLVDQVSKALVRDAIEPGERVDVAGILHLVNTRNSGLARGMLAGAPVWIVVAISLAAIAALLALALQLPARRVTFVPVGLLLGGGVGNLVDRLRSGSVTDFIVVGHGGAANLADQAITLGVVSLVVVAFWPARARGQRPTPAPAAPPPGG
jgi:signal peptidase II